MDSILPRISSEPVPEPRSKRGAHRLAEAVLSRLGSLRDILAGTDSESAELGYLEFAVSKRSLTRFRIIETERSRRVATLDRLMCSSSAVSLVLRSWP